MSRHPRWWYHGQNHKSQTFLQSLRHAVRGLVLGVLFEANVRRQVLLGSAVVILGVALNISVGEWLVVLALAVCVITLEFINSALEALADAVHPGYHEHIQRSKDLSAAAVLTVSGVAAVVGLYIFLPRLLELVG